MIECAECLHHYQAVMAATHRATGLSTRGEPAERHLIAVRSDQRRHSWSCDLNRQRISQYMSMIKADHKDSKES